MPDSEQIRELPDRRNICRLPITPQIKSPDSHRWLDFIVIEQRIGVLISVLVSQWCRSTLVNSKTVGKSQRFNIMNVNCITKIVSFSTTVYMETMATASLSDCLNLSMDNILPSEQTTLPTWREDKRPSSSSCSQWQEVSISPLHARIGNKNLFSFITVEFQMTWLHIALPCP